MPDLALFINSPLSIGSLKLKHRLIQGPLAGYSCAPFRESFSFYQSPAYAVSEMISAQDVLSRHKPESRYLKRSSKENLLAYQLSGIDSNVMAKAAYRCQELGADIIDINCGCPKPKIRKKGAGSALLETPERLQNIISLVKANIRIPLTVKIRLQNIKQDTELAKQIESAGADALIVHGRKWSDDYDVACKWQQIASIKNAVAIPVIANGDIFDMESLHHAWLESTCDAFMISRAGSGKPWLYKQLLTNDWNTIDFQEIKNMFILHVNGLALLEDKHKAMCQSKSLFRYYFKSMPTSVHQNYFQIHAFEEIADFIRELT